MKLQCQVVDKTPFAVTYNFGDVGMVLVRKGFGKDGERAIILECGTGGLYSSTLYAVSHEYIDILFKNFSEECAHYVAQLLVDGGGVMDLNKAMQ